MTYNELLQMLLLDNVYDMLKQNEENIFWLIPELKKCKGFEQNNSWHIYDVYEHILHVVSNVEPNSYLRIAALFHDIGKPLVYKQDENGIGHFYNHWNKSIEIFKKYENKFILTNEEINLINNLIFYHDVNIEKMKSEELDKMINIFGSENIKLLFTLKRADLLAQSPKYHNLLFNIDTQENNIIKTKILKH